MQITASRYMSIHAALNNVFSFLSNVASKLRIINFKHNFINNPLINSHIKDSVLSKLATVYKW